MRSKAVTTNEEVIAKAAELLAGRHQNAALAPILEAQMLRVASITPSSGGGGYVDWIAALQSLGEIIVSIAKAEGERVRFFYDPSAKAIVVGPRVDPFANTSSVEGEAE